MDLPLEPRVALQWSSSSPSGQSRVPSHIPARDTQSPVSPQRKACGGHVLVSLHFSSDPSGQSCLPSHTKNQLIHTPVDRHCKTIGIDIIL